MYHIPFMYRHVRCSVCKQVFKSEDSKSAIHTCNSCKEKQGKAK